MTREKSTAELVYEFPVEPVVLATIVKRSAAETNRVSARANRERISLWVPSLLSPYGTKFEGKVEPTERGSVLRGTLRRSVVLRLQGALFCARTLIRNGRPASDHHDEVDQSEQHRTRPHPP